MSVSHGLLAADVSAKVPEQLIGAFVVSMRPAIGAVAALVALVILHAKDTFKFFDWDMHNSGIVIAVSFAAGFSERFIVGAIERTSLTRVKADSALVKRSTNSVRSRLELGCCPESRDRPYHQMAPFQLSNVC